MFPRPSIFSEQEFVNLCRLKDKWSGQTLLSECYDIYKPNEKMLAHLKFHKWRYENKYLTERRW